MKTNSKIRCKNLWKAFGKIPKKILKSGDEKLLQAYCTENKRIVAVKNVNLQVNEGECFVIIGLSGSGKSTLLRCLNTLYKPTLGDVFYEDENINEMPKDKLRDVLGHKIAMVFQHFSLLPHRNILENAAFGLELQKVKKQTRNDKALQTLKLMGLDEYAKLYPFQLSGGMKQRVGIARALAVDPEVLLMDEPFSALDPIIRKQLQNEVLKISRDLNKTIVFITHDLNEALSLGDRIAIMKEGEISQEGTPEDIIKHPANAYVAEFINTIKTRVNIS